MDISELERLMEVVRQSNIRELTLRQGEARLTIRKKAEIENEESGEELIVMNPHVPYADIDTESPFFPDEQEADNGTMVTAQIVGIFHHVKPIVGLGARVQSGQVIGAIEALTLGNDVVAPSAGVVTDVLVEDSMPVEYGHPLFVIRPDA